MIIKLATNVALKMEKRDMIYKLESRRMNDKRGDAMKIHSLWRVSCPDYIVSEDLLVSRPSRDLSCVEVR